MTKSSTPFQELIKEQTKNLKEFKKQKKAALRWANDYMFKHGIEMPQCQFPGCTEQSNQKHIPIPNKANRRYINFFCTEHMQIFTNPTLPSLTDEEKEKDLSAEQKQKILEQREKEQLVEEMPEPYDITDLKKTKSGGKTKTSLRREIRTLLRTSLSHLDQSHCENIDCKNDSVLKDISYYLRPDGSDYNVSFLCRSCRGKVNYEKTILKKTPSYDLKKLAKQNEDKSDEEKYAESFKEANQFLIDRLKAECSARNIFPQNNCTACGASISKDQLFGSKTDVVFPRTTSHMHVAFFCENCQLLSDAGHSYDTFFKYGYEPQDLTQFAQPHSCIRTHLEKVEKIQSETTPIGKR